ncbi:MAG: hypothetical protein HKN87_10705 [Saprospiraceae bacterium]|nr:hypothetical protein [Saprospiraceae bacterium]
MVAPISLPEETGPKAVKFKIGGRPTNVEKPERRTEQLIPLKGKHFDSSFTIYAACIGSSDAAEAMRIWLLAIGLSPISGIG